MAVEQRASIEEIIQVLRREYLFQGLSDEQLTWIAAQFSPKTLERNTIIYSQGSPGDAFFIIFQGKVRAMQVVRGMEQPLNVLGPGDFFGEEALLFHHMRTQTMVTVETTTLLRMEGDRFETMLAAYPRIRDTLQATAVSRRLSRTHYFRWLNADEVIYFISRKHELYLFVALLAPIVMGVLSIPVLAFGLADMGTPFLFRLAMVVGVGLLVGSIAWGIWSFIDWGNDYYIVTNQRVVWLEKIIGLYDSRREAPLETILAVNVISSQLGRILNYGSVSVRTFTGGILMRKVDQAERFATFVRGFKEQAVKVSKEEEARAIEQALEQALTRSMEVTGRKPIVVPEEPPPILAPVRPAQERQETVRDRIETFLKVRYERNGVITYRKHWFILLSKTFQPLIGIAVVVLGTAWLLWQAALDRPIFPPLFVGTFGSLALLALLGWLGYQYLDWRNDIYRLTPEQILDIERKPLGQETKKTAPLESILSIEHERGNLIGILLNYGNVTINVGQTQFIFFGVYNPDQVHQDIADYREALNRRKRAAEAARQRDQMVNWLVTYYQQTEGLEGEQGDFEQVE